MLKVVASSSKQRDAQEVATDFVRLILELCDSFNQSDERDRCAIGA